MVMVETFGVSPRVAALPLLPRAEQIRPAGIQKPLDWKTATVLFTGEPHYKWDPGLSAQIKSLNKLLGIDSDKYLPKPSGSFKTDLWTPSLYTSAWGGGVWI